MNCTEQGAKSMSDIHPKKLVILYILDILQKYTDEEHRLSQKEIQNILKREYEIGIVYDLYSISSVPSLVLSLCFSCLCILIALSQYLQTVRIYYFFIQYSYLQIVCCILDGFFQEYVLVCMEVLYIGNYLIQSKNYFRKGEFF